MPGAHDRGGWPNTDPIDNSEHHLADWERRVDALNMILGQKKVRTTDEMRRAIESLEPAQYEKLSYYEKWTAAVEILMIEKGILSTEEIDRKMADLEQDAI
jgi:hypothetical protein